MSTSANASSSPALCPAARSPAAPQEVSEFTAKAERYVGVTSGGMDQAISIMGMPGIAKLVEFNPVGGGG
jgi:N-acetylgalactosamine kinase